VQASEPTVTEPTIEPIVTEEPKSNTIYIEGLGEIDPSEVAEWKRGYMRTQDYTKKTQEVAAQRKEAEKAIELYQQVQSQGIENVDTSQFNGELDSIKQELQNIKIERDIESLQRKYNDFDAMEVLNIAMEKGFGSLEEAYIFNKGAKLTQEPVNQDELIKKIREQVLAEFESERKANTSIISTTDTNSPIINEQPKLSPEEDTVRQKLGISVEEWFNWR
jgi:hypothetical protein